MAAIGLASIIQEKRAQLKETRKKIRLQHDAGTPAFQTCAHWTDVVDLVVQEIGQSILAKIDQPNFQFALVAHGGYGRRDLAPFSDTDLMLLVADDREDASTRLARGLAQDLADTGLNLGFSLRTTSQSLSLCWRDATVFTSLAESRFLLGSEDLFSQFENRLRQGARRRRKRLIPAIEAARREERQRYGETVYLLHPDVKRSRGCLRDIQLVRWIGFARYGEVNLEQLHQRGILSTHDHQILKRGYQYLLRLRNELHLHAGRAVDSLDRATQVRIAQQLGYEEAGGVLAVEEFMRTYYETTSQIQFCASQFVESATIRNWFTQAFGRIAAIPLGEGYYIGIRHIRANPTAIARLRDNPIEVIDFLRLANKVNRRIDPISWQAIRLAMQENAIGPLGADAAARFMEFLQYPLRLGEFLRKLHAMRVLENIVPAFKHARCLMQFNDYHKYTVDAHCIRAVEAATDYLKHPGLLGSVYRNIKNKALLHLALLIHDLGKGFTDDHSIVGERIAEQTGELLRLSTADIELLKFLVREHLTMTHTAFRFDLTQVETIINFAKKIGSITALQMLYVLSCADLDAVGPGALNDWKENLLNQLYQRTESQFGESRPDKWFHSEVAARKEALLNATPKTDSEWWSTQVAGISPTYLLNETPSRLVSDLSKLKRLSHEQPVVAWSTAIPQADATEYSVGVLQDSDFSLGIVHRITGALARMNVQILSAEIHNQPGLIAWDRFLTRDMEFPEPTSEQRGKEVCKAIQTAFSSKVSSAPTFTKRWKIGQKKSADALPTQPTQVQFDNDASEEYSIISIFAYDRLGLLYDITKVLFEQEIVLHVAKISTHLDQVVDVFYVTDTSGRKVTEPTRLYTLRQRLLAAAEG